MTKIPIQIQREMSKMTLFSVSRKSQNWHFFSVSRKSAKLTLFHVLTQWLYPKEAWRTCPTAPCSTSAPVRAVVGWVQVPGVVGVWGTCGPWCTPRGTGPGVPTALFPHCKPTVLPLTLKNHRKSPKNHWKSGNWALTDTTDTTDTRVLLVFWHFFTDFHCFSWFFRQNEHFLRPQVCRWHFEDFW